MKSRKLLLTATLSFSIVLPIGLMPIANTNYNPALNVIDNKASVTRLTEQPNDLATLRDTSVDQLITLPLYDSRKYNIVTYPKNQQSEGLCWCYSTAGASETSLLRQGVVDINPDEFKQVDLSERNIDYDTNVRNDEFDHLGLNPNDNYSRTLGIGGLVRNAAATISMWNGPVNQFDKNGSYIYERQYLGAQYQLQNAERVSSMKDSIKKKGLQPSIDRVKRLIAKYGAVTASYTSYSTEPKYLNTNYKGPDSSKNAGHAVTLVGWDDSIPADSYKLLTADCPGGWIVKNSWGDKWGDDKTGFFYISYDSDLFDIFGFDYELADNSKNNYHWDANTLEGSDGIESGQSPTNAAIFPVKKANYNMKEYLTGINVGITGENVTITADVYSDVPVNFNDPFDPMNKPISSTKIASVTQTVPYEGYVTLKLPHEVELKHGQNFSVVVNVDNPDKNARLLFSNDMADDNMTFSLDSSNSWVNNGTKTKNAAARIRAITREVPVPDAVQPFDLSYANVELNNKLYIYGSTEGLPTPTSVSIGNNRIDPSEYSVSYSPLSISSKDVVSDTQIIGSGNVILTGKGKYANTSIKQPFKVRVGTSPSLEGLGTYYEQYDRPTWGINLNVGQSVNKYSDIKLPKGFEWFDLKNPNEPVVNGTSKYDLRYVGDDEKCYRWTWWDKSKVILNKVSDGSVAPQPGPQLPPIEENAPPPSPPAAPPSVQLNDVSINIGNTTFTEGDTIYASAQINPSSLSGVTYNWYIGDQSLNQHSSSISIPANLSYNKQQLRVEARYNDNTRNSSVMLTVNPRNNPTPDVTPPVNPPPTIKPEDTVQPPHNPPNNGGNHGNDSSNTGTHQEPIVSNGWDWWMYALIGSGSLMITGGIIWAIIAAKKGKKNEDEVAPVIKLYSNNQNSDIKTIPVKSSYQEDIQESPETFETEIQE